MLTGQESEGNLSWDSIREIERAANVLSGFLVDVGRSGKERVGHVDAGLLKLSNDGEAEESR